MRLYTFEAGRRTRIGAETDGKIVDLNAAHAARTKNKDAVLAASMIDLIRGGPAALKKAKQALAYAEANPKQRGLAFDSKKVKVLAPIPRPGKILCSGLNYKSHIKEEPGAKFLKDPRFFAKLPNCVIGPDEPILHPGAKFEVDWEVELAIVFGKECYRATQKEAMDYIFGYTILHDVSARWVQFKDANETMGKNFDTFCPLGPCIVTADEIADPSKLHITLKVNGKVKQDETNDDWCFPLKRMIEWLSMGMTLEPGDVMSTGCPAGCGCFRNPKEYLKPGDVCELEIQPIGKLVNPVKAAPYKFLTKPNE